MDPLGEKTDEELQTVAQYFNLPPQLPFDRETVIELLIERLTRLAAERGISLDEYLISPEFALNQLPNQDLFQRAAYWNLKIPDPFDPKTDRKKLIDMIVKQRNFIGRRLQRLNDDELKRRLLFYRIPVQEPFNRNNVINNLVLKREEVGDAKIQGLTLEEFLAQPAEKETQTPVKRAGPPMNKVRFVREEERVFTPEQIEEMDTDDQNNAVRTWRLTLTLDYLKSYPDIFRQFINDLEGLGLEIVDASLNNFIVKVPLDENENTSPTTFYQKATTQRLTPQTQLQRQFPIWQAISNEVQTPGTPKGVSMWDLHLDKRYLKSSTATVGQLKDLLAYFQIRVIDQTPDWIRVEMPNDQAPSVYLREKYNQLNIDMKPRHLTADEIEDILNVVPEVRSADPVSGAESRLSILNVLREQLESMPPITPIGIPDLKDEIVMNFEESVVHPGSMVGVTAAEAMGQPITQMALKSVDWNEQMLIAEDSDTKVITIGQWIDDLIEANQEKITLIPENQTEHLVLDRPVSVPSTDEDGRVNWHQVSAVMRHLPGGNLIKIRTQSGRTVSASKHRSFLTYKNGKLEPTYGTDVVVGDLVPITRDLPSLGQTKVLNVEHLFPKNEWLHGTEILNAGESHTSKPGWWKANANVTFTVPHARCDSMMKCYQTKKDFFQRGCVYPKNVGHSVSHIPVEFNLNEEFGYIIGAYLADGLSTETFVSFSKKVPEILLRVTKWADKLGVKYHLSETRSKHVTQNGTESSGVSLTLHSVILAKIFKSWIGTGSSNKIIPPEAFSAPLPFIKGIIDGYFSGDGTVNKKGYLVITSASEDLILGFAALCSYFGIFGKKSGVQMKKNNFETEQIKYSHSYTIRNNFVHTFATKIGLSHPGKNEALQACLNRQYRHPIGKFYQELHHVILDPIVEVSEVPSSHEFVYDITVPDTLRFALFSGINCMDSFHQSGSAKSISTGVDAIRELLNVSVNRKFENCTIYFKRQDLTFDDVYEKSRTIVDTTVFDLMFDYDIELATNVGLTWWHQAYQASTGRYYRDLPENRARKDLSEVSWVLRLHLDVNDIYKYKVTMQQIVDTIHENNENVIFAIPSPINIGIIDIFPIESNIPNALGERMHAQDRGHRKGKKYNLGKTGDLSSLIFLDKFTLPRMEKITVKGIPRIKRLFPQDAVTLQIVKDEVKAYNDEQIREQADPEIRGMMERSWHLIFNRIRMIQTGIKPDKLKRLAEAVGIMIYDIAEDYMTVIMPPIPEQMVKEDEKKPATARKDRRFPTNWIAFRIKEDEEEKQQMEDEQKRAGNIMYVRPSTAIERESKMFYAETNGSNLIGLLAHPEVDQTRTICNNIHQIYETFGVEAARTMLIREFDFVIREAGSSINPRHIILLVEFMNNLGQPTAMTFSGISRTPIGATAKASFEKAMETFINDAGIGKREPIRGTTPSIYVGQRARLGTGFMDIVIDQKKVDEYEARAALERKVTGKEPMVNPAEFAQAVNDFDLDDLVIARDLVHPNDDDDDIAALLAPGGQPRMEMAPEFIITDKAQLTAPLIKGRQIRPQLLDAVKGNLNKIPQLPNEKPGKTVTINVPTGARTAPLVPQPDRPPLVLPVIENEGLGLLPIVSDMVKALAPRVPATRIAIFPPGQAAVRQVGTAQAQVKPSPEATKPLPRFRLGQVPQIKPAPRPKPVEVKVEIVDLDAFLQGP